MKTRAIIGTLLSVALVLALPVSAQAVSIGINLSSDDTLSTVAEGASGFSGGYQTQTYWNNCFASPGNTFFVSSPVDSAGAAIASGLSVSLGINWGGGWGYYHAVENGDGPANTLGYTAWSAQYAANVTVSNIPASMATYSVAGYMKEGAGWTWEVQTGKTGSSVTFDSRDYGLSGFPIGAIQIIQEGQAPAPNFTANPGSGPLAFGPVGVSTISSAQTVALNNIGDAAGDVTAASVTGGFAFTDPLPGTPTYSVAASGAAVYNIVLPAQTLPGAYAGVATFTTSTGTFTYNLSATVIAHDGDVNGDGQVSLLDYNIIKVNFGNVYESGNHWGDGDVNGDLQVGLLDFNIVKAHFGHTTGDVGVTAVPEPATMSLLALAGLAALRRRR